VETTLFCWAIEGKRQGSSSASQGTRMRPRRQAAWVRLRPPGRSVVADKRTQHRSSAHRSIPATFRTRPARIHMANRPDRAGRSRQEPRRRLGCLYLRRQRQSDRPWRGEGLTKTISDTATGELLGAHIIGAEATELISGFSVGKALETTATKMKLTIFRHGM
jgi:pyruvate/2-oxoglutarate dehydrogenase complex dihydrolipoamide dehydrogenase (E3) component